MSRKAISDTESNLIITPINIADNEGFAKEKDIFKLKQFGTNLLKSSRSDQSGLWKRL